jgi:hypothetical protein
MKDLTKKDIKNIVKDSNEEFLKEYYLNDQGEANQVVAARKDTLHRYESFVQGAKNSLDQIIEKAKMDYGEGIIQKADLDFLIDDQMERARQTVEYVVSSLMALRDQGIKPTETSPIYPTSRYEE